MKPQVRILATAEIERIHDLSLQVLERTGVVVHYPPAQDLLRRRGAIVDDGRGLVRIPRRLVERALRSAPRCVTLFGQANATRDCLLSVDGGFYARTSTGLNWIVDAGAQARRLSLIRDLCLIPNLEGSVVTFMDIDRSRLDATVNAIMALPHYAEMAQHYR